MDEKDFAHSKTGRLFWESNGMYYRFEPNTLPFEFQPSKQLLYQLTRTSLALGRLDGLTMKFTPDEVLLLKIPFFLKEATISSEIEGTRSTLTDVYRGEKQKETDKQKALDNAEIGNYVRALEFGLNSTEGITEDLIKKMHKILLQGVRGTDKDPGEYKTAQNAIGRRQDTFETAKFVPASIQTTPSLMRNFIEYVNTPDDSSQLFNIGLAHYQFEVIHPFRDGNGRLGRLLIMLMLCKQKILANPLLYLSEYFNRNRSTYADRLYGVSSKNEIEAWLSFFLKSLEAQANSSLVLLQKLENYKQELHKSLRAVSESPRIHLVVDALFKNPFITIVEVAGELQMSTPGASNLVHKLEKMGILMEITGKKSSKVFKAHKILDILEGEAAT